jgi:hypothetical protein
MQGTVEREAEREARVMTGGSDDDDDYPVHTRRANWRRRLLGAVIALTLILGGGLVYLRQPPNPITEREAVTAFREKKEPTATSKPSADAARPTSTAPRNAGDAAGATGTASAPKPDAVRSASGTPSRPSAGGHASLMALPFGVYAYATDGFEETNALGGLRHQYPSETYLTVAPAKCGRSVRWQPLEERWDESHFCATSTEVELRSLTAYREFYKRGQRSQYDCQPDAFVLRADASEGDTWTWSCYADNGRTQTKVTIEGRGTMSVGGTRVPVVHTTFQSVLTGATRGTQRQERWTDARTGLPIKLVTETDTEGDGPIGVISYTERYTLTLKSLSPKQ